MRHAGPIVVVLLLAMTSSCREISPPAPSSAAEDAAAETVADGQSSALPIRVFDPDGALAFSLVPWTQGWALVSPTGIMTGRVEGAGNATRVVNASGSELAAEIRTFTGGFEILDDKAHLLATVRGRKGTRRVLAEDGRLLAEISAAGTVTLDGAPLRSPLRVEGEAFPLAAEILAMSSISFAGRVALLFALSDIV